MSRTFLWVFTVDTPQYYVSDCFSVDGNHYCAVNLLREGQIADGEEEIRKVINKLNNTIQLLEKKPDINKIEYSYQCVKPEEECAVFAVVDRELGREPVTI